MNDNVMMYIVASITQMIVFMIFMKVIFGMKRSLFWTPLCWGIVELISCFYYGLTPILENLWQSSASLDFGEMITPILLYVASLQVILLWMCKGSWQKKYFLSWAYAIFSIIIGIAIMLIMEQISYISINFSGMKDGYEVLIAILVQMFLIILLELCMFLREDYFRYKTNLKNGVGIFVISIGCFVSSFILVNQIMYEAWYYPNGSVGNMIMFLCINFFIYYYYFVFVENSKKEMERTIYEKQIGMYQEWYEGMQYTRNEVRAFRHDMNNHFLVLNNLCKRGEKEDDTRESFAEIKKYIEKMGVDATASAYDTDSGNLMLDSVIDLKKSYALAKGIAFQTEINVPKQMNYNRFDVVILLGNLLDNAIEACESLACESLEGKKEITLKIQYKMRNLIIMVQNSYDGHMDGQFGVSAEEPTWKTTKNDIQNHGIGMNNIMKVVKKYNGVMKWQAEQGTFRVDMLLYEFDENVQKDSL